MQIITPIEITDDILTSPIAEPDISAGEVAWVDPNAFMEIDNVNYEIYSSVAYGGSVYHFTSSADVVEVDCSSHLVTVHSNAIPFYSGAIYAAQVTKSGIVYGCGVTGSAITKLDLSTMTATNLGVTTQIFYCSSVIYDESIYFLGRNETVGGSGSFLKINVITDNTEYLSSTSVGTYTDCISIAGVIYGIDYFGNMVKLNTDTDTISVFNHGYKGLRCVSLGFDGFVYASGDYGVIIKIDVENESGEIAALSSGELRVSYLDPSGSIYFVGIASGSTGAFLNVNRFDVGNQSNSVIVSIGVSNPNVEMNAIQYCNREIITAGKGYDNICVFGCDYTDGEQVVGLDSHGLYQAAASTRSNPVIGSGLTPPSWVKVSATNKYKMFDYSINTASSSIGDIQLLPAQTATTLSMYGMSNVASVNIIVKENSSSGAEIYNETKDLTLPTPVDDMIANEALYRSKVMFSDLPVFANPWINIVINRADTAENWSIGDIAIGNARTMGVVVYQSSTSRTSYDSVETDDFGNETIISRPSAEYTTFELSLQPIYADYVERILKDSLNKPRVYIGDKGNNEKLFTFGYYERSPVTYVSPSLCETTLKVRGLV